LASIFVGASWEVIPRSLLRESLHLKGVLSGFDRLVFRGYLTPLCSEGGMASYLKERDVSISDSAKHSTEMTKQLIEASIKYDTLQGVSHQYFAKNFRKEEYAKQVAKERGITSGLICSFSTLESCQSFQVYQSKDPQKGPYLVSRPRKCKFIYKYFLDETLGLMGVRMQTWYPFTVQIWVNGREILAQQMKKAGLYFKKQDNCFLSIEDLLIAQKLMEEQTSWNWSSILDRIGKTVNPDHVAMFGEGRNYYWSVYQSEWASDIYFKDPQVLHTLYDEMLFHAIKDFKSPNVMRFLGNRVNQDGSIPKNFDKEVMSSFQERPEGARVKHYLNKNSVKMYNKQGNLLRVETTINQPTHAMKVLRAKKGSNKKEYRPLRKGVVDLKARGKVSDAINGRYVNAFADLKSSVQADKIFQEVHQRIVLNGKTIRGLDVFGKDAEILKVMGKGEFRVEGFRNKDLRNLLFPATTDKKEQKRQSAKISRLLRIMRAHGIIKKFPKSHRYQLTAKGQRLIGMINGLSRHTVESLTNSAA
jgi:hypothetical protein